MREEKIYLPSLKRVRISNYSLYNGDIDYEFVDGLNLIIGGNGVGKTTFISIIKYALIGLYKKDLDVRVYKGEKRLIRGKYTNCNTYFRSRTEELESDKEGGVELWFNINETEFYVKRSLYDVKIEEANYIKAGVEYKIPGKILKQELYKEDGTDREDSLQYMYEKTVANEANLSDFEDFIFFVNQILLFGESRENVLWSESVQERLFSSFLNDASLEKQRKEHSLEAKYYDSVSRHKQEEIKAIVRVLKQIDVDNNEKKVSINKISLLSEIESLEGKQEQIGNNREICQKKIAALYKEASELSYNINNKEKEKTRLESKSKQEFWPGINPKYAVYKRQFVGNHVCPICNANLENKKIEDKSDECFFCHSKIVYDSSMTPLIESINNELAELTEKRKRIEKQIADYEIELSDYDSDFRSNKIDLFKKKNELRIWESKKEEKQNESSYLAMMNRIDELTLEKEKAQKKSEQNQNECKAIMKNIEENMNEITKNISNIFADFAEAFMKLPCYLTFEKTINSKIKIFIPVIDDKIRYDQEALSESQRFFVDYSFRMSILSYFYECPSFYICETPDSSLDISYEENAADIFMKYLTNPNVLILTSNLNNSTFIKSVLNKAKKKKVLNLLKYGKVSLVQRNHEMLNMLSREIEEMCNE